MKNVLNLSGGGAAALGFELAVIDHLENKKGIQFDEVYGVSAGGLAGLLYSTLGIKEASEFARSIDKDVYKLQRSKLLWSWLPWKKPVKGLVEWSPLEKKLEKALEGKKFQKKFVCQLGDLYSSEVIYTTSSSPIEMIKYVLAGMSIPGLAPPLEHDEWLLCDAGAVENVIATSHMPTDAMIWVVSVHSQEAKGLTPLTYEQAGIADMFAQSTAHATYVMYRDDMEKLRQTYKQVKVIEATKHLEVFIFSEENILDAMVHGSDVARRL